MEDWTMATDMLADLLDDEKKAPPGAVSGDSDSLDTLLGDDPEDVEESAWLWKQPERVITLPFAWKVGDELVREVEIRPMDGVCDDKMVDDTGTRRERHERMEKVLSHCIVRIGTKKVPADYKMADPQEPLDYFVKDIETMPIPNRMTLLVRLRQLSLHDVGKGVSGHKFVFHMTCPLCKKHNPRLSVRLDDLKVVSVDDAFCKEETHTFKSGDHVIEWRVPTAKDEPKMSRIVEETKQALLSALLAVSILTINGKKPEKLSEIQALPKSVRNGLQNDIQRGGIDVSIVNTCGHCSREFTCQLPWGQKSFFFPSDSES